MRKLRLYKGDADWELYLQVLDAHDDNSGEYYQGNNHILRWPSGLYNLDETDSPYSVWWADTPEAELWLLLNAPEPNTARGERWEGE